MLEQNFKNNSAEKDEYEVLANLTVGQTISVKGESFTLNPQKEIGMFTGKVVEKDVKFGTEDGFVKIEVIPVGGPESKTVLEENPFGEYVGKYILIKKAILPQGNDVLSYVICDENNDLVISGGTYLKGIFDLTHSEDKAD